MERSAAGQRGLSPLETDSVSSLVPDASAAGGFVHAEPGLQPLQINIQIQLEEHFCA